MTFKKSFVDIPWAVVSKRKHFGYTMGQIARSSNQPVCFFDLMEGFRTCTDLMGPGCKHRKPNTTKQNIKPLGRVRVLPVDPRESHTHVAQGGAIQYSPPLRSVRNSEHIKADVAFL